MRKLRYGGLLKFIPILLALVIILGICTVNRIQTKDVSNKEVKPSQEDKAFNEDLQKQLNEQNQKEEDKVKEALRKEAERKEKERLERLANPALIAKELKKTSKLITYEGVYNFNHTFENNSALAKKSCKIDITYRFGIGEDLNSIVVGDIVKDSVVIKIPKDQIKLMYCDNIPSLTMIDSTKSWNAKQYTPEQINIMTNFSKEKTIEVINASREYFDEANEGIKDTLEKIILKIGYRKVIFEEI